MRGSSAGALPFPQYLQQPRFDFLHTAAHGAALLQTRRVDIHGALVRREAQRDGAWQQPRQRGEQGQRPLAAQPQRHGDDHLVKLRVGPQGEPRHLEVRPHQFGHEVRRQPQRPAHRPDIGAAAQRPVKEGQDREAQQEADAQAPQADLAQKQCPDQRQNQVEGKTVHEHRVTARPAPPPGSLDS
ncbi:hypothetical protein DR_0749 [Deinococcus radiodurans R1 = ATCC 13939 = DSM 20539]|uniref:Uncharacterized protein n=1 Tax=Deinococcus radiodurans (strain ATCC 13939 / DSM 20539 / JCM 16871 / CCUG 27074 / LMG 4051 / NBRC 15346 / NCIMB 9279 / VKM B-1422 / R1) TaxID=243230 RepID=Q9RWC0_DEIRA|nr:hypothetical protein DR_0749 [Deinococcus radiodurans R1 = ATCC 13939 = DSM 20539]